MEQGVLHASQLDAAKAEHTTALEACTASAAVTLHQALAAHSSDAKSDAPGHAQGQQDDTGAA